VASLTWSLILHVDVGSRPDCPSQRALGALLTWARESVEGYDDVSIGRTRYAWSEAFADGMAWCALIDVHEPSLFDVQEAMRMTPEERLRALFEMAETQLDIPVLCTDFTPVDDPRIAITFTAQLRNALEARQMLSGQSELELARAEEEKERRLLAERDQQRVLEERRQAELGHAMSSIREDQLQEVSTDHEKQACEPRRLAKPPAVDAVTIPQDALAVDMMAIERNSSLRHSVAWKLRRRREQLTGTAYKSPTKSPARQLARASSTGPTTPRLAV